MLWFYWRRSKTEGRSKKLPGPSVWTGLICFAQIISFSIVCLLLHRFAYKPILKMLEERRQQIAQGQINSGKDQSRVSPD